MNLEFYKDKLDKLTKLFTKELSEVMELPVEKVETPKQEKVETVENKVEETQTEQVVEADNTTPEQDTPEQEAPANDDNENKALDELAAMVADLQQRLNNVEAQLADMSKVNSELKEVQNKMSSAIEILAEQPTGIEPKKTESAFSKLNEQKSQRESKLKEVSKYFN